MSLFVVIEILTEDGTSVTDDPDAPIGREFDIAQLKIMEQDRVADGYINLDGTNYVFNSRIVGILHPDESPGYDDTRDFRLVVPIETAL
jgi:hypothetical protein